MLLWRSCWLGLDCSSSQVRLGERAGREQGFLHPDSLVARKGWLPGQHSPGVRCRSAAGWAAWGWMVANNFHWLGLGRSPNCDTLKLHFGFLFSFWGLSPSTMRREFWLQATNGALALLLQTCSWDRCTPTCILLLATKQELGSSRSWFLDCWEYQTEVKICPIWVRLAVLRKVPLVEFQTLFSHLKTWIYMELWWNYGTMMEFGHFMMEFGQIWA